MTCNEVGSDGHGGGSDLERHRVGKLGVDKDASPAGAPPAPGAHQSADLGVATMLERLRGREDTALLGDDPVQSEIHDERVGASEAEEAPLRTSVD
jgi:hypothetical protein